MSQTASTTGARPSPSARLTTLGIQLPEAPKPVASYVPVRIEGSHAYVSGQLPLIDGKLAREGAVPSKVSPEDAQADARQCAINALACLKQAVGSIERVRGVVKVGVFVASDPGFGGHPKIANGASDLLVEIFGEAGRHARAAVGVASLPLNAPVEVEFIFEVDL
ncbi:MAG: RidA family protein [Phycisphaerales bacterium]|nr:RidA family protein [Phycisphaerales bacterium]